MRYKSLRQQTLHYFARPHDSVRREPVTAPAAWNGADMREREDWSVELGAAEIDELRSALSHAMATGRPRHALTPSDFPLPTLAPRIETWRHEIRHGRGFIRIRGVPVQQWRTEEAETFFWCFGLHLGPVNASPGRRVAAPDACPARREEGV